MSRSSSFGRSLHSHTWPLPTDIRPTASQLAASRGRKMSEGGQRVIKLGVASQKAYVWDIDGEHNHAER